MLFGRMRSRDLNKAVDFFISMCNNTTMPTNTNEAMKAIADRALEAGQVTIGALEDRQTAQRLRTSFYAFRRGQRACNNYTYDRLVLRLVEDSLVIKVNVALAAYERAS
jgi:hypothetical protein